MSTRPAMRPLLAALAVLFLVAMPAVAKTTLAPGYVAVDNVVYYHTNGILATGHLVNEGDNSGPYVQDFVGCVMTQLRPETGGGRIMLVGLVDSRTDMTFDFDQYTSPDGYTPSPMPMITLNKSLGYDPPVRAEMAAWGIGYMRTTGENFTDPLGNGDVLYADFYVGLEGVQDDETGERLDNLDKGDDEMHLWVRSPDDAVPRERQLPRISRNGDLPAGGYSPNEAFGERFTFYNSKLGGTGIIDLQATASAPAGMNEYSVAIRSPTGKMLANVTVTPAMGAPESEHMEIPLSEFGEYTVDVRGKVAFTQYSLDITLMPPKKLDLHFWWEEIARGEAAAPAYTQCKNQMGYSTVPGATVGRQKPPSWIMEAVVIGVIAAATTIILTVKVATESYGDATMKKRFGR